MYCPNCGTELIGPKAPNDTNDKSEQYGCPKGCYHIDDYPLIKHGAFKGHKSKPGDSWSLSWIK